MYPTEWTKAIVRNPEKETDYRTKDQEPQKTGHDYRTGDQKPRDKDTRTIYNDPYVKKFRSKPERRRFQKVNRFINHQFSCRGLKSANPRVRTNLYTFRMSPKLARC